MLLRLIFAMMIGMAEKRPARCAARTHITPALAKLAHAVARPFIWSVRGH